MVKQRTHSHVDRAAAAAANQWLERLPTATPAENEEFAAWLKQSPLHVRELLLGDFIDDALSRFDSERKLSVTLPPNDSNVVPLGERPPGETSPAPRPRPWRTWLGGVAAMLATVAVTLFYFGFNAGSPTYVTGIGEQRTVSLADGSLVALNVKTSLTVAFTAQWRDIHLQSGQALFTVAHDTSRPFRVHVNGTTVKAVGTKFDVRREGARAVVYVVEGRVRIEPPELASVSVTPMQSPRLAPVELAPGESAAIRQDGEVDPNAALNVKALSAWQDRRLVFEERPLSEIAAEFATYVRSPTLAVEGDDVRRRLYTGSFDADRLDNFISYLERDPSLAVVRDGERVIVRSAGTPR